MIGKRCTEAADEGCTCHPACFRSRECIISEELDHKGAAGAVHSRDETHEFPERKNR
jgi:hypothetical protein